MTDWLLLAPVALLAIVLMCLFVGCVLDSEGQLSSDPIPPAAPYGPIITGTPNVVSYWRLGEASGTTAGDELGTHPGTYTDVPPMAAVDTPNGASAAAPGTFALGQPGLIASEPARTSVTFNGGRVEVPHTDNALDPAQFSVEAWVFPLWDKEERAFRAIVASRDDVAGQPHGYVLFATPFSGDPGNQYRWEAWVANGTGSGLDAFTRAAGNLVIFEATTHLVMTFDGTVVKLYTDGTLRGQETATGFAANTAQPLRIGSGATVFPINGRIQEVAVYARALTEQEIFTRYVNNH